jgi:hypothetical protein
VNATATVTDPVWAILYNSDLSIREKMDRLNKLADAARAMREPDHDLAQRAWMVSVAFEQGARDAMEAVRKVARV